MSRTDSLAQINGVGLEIGAGHAPLPMSKDACVAYVDLRPVERLRKEYPDARQDLNHAVADGETLEGWLPNSLDFIVSSHVLEHCKSPIRALETWMRLLKPGGLCWIAVPLKDFCFDSVRPNTSLEHLKWCHDNWDPAPHYREWISLIDKLSGDALEAAIVASINEESNIHFHALNADSWQDLFVYCADRCGYDIDFDQEYGHEVVYLLRKK